MDDGDARQVFGVIRIAVVVLGKNVVKARHGFRPCGTTEPEEIGKFRRTIFEGAFSQIRVTHRK